jgi:hypothetical protein
MYKKLLSALLVMGAASTAIAQPTLTATTFNPVAGNQFLIHESASAFAAGPSGANVVWDFSGIGTTAIDTGLVKSCTAVTPSCSTFLPTGGQNIAQTVPAPLKVIDYLYAGTDSMAQWGYYQSADTFLKFTDPMVTMKYPFTYMSNFVDSFHGSYKLGTTLPTLSERGQITVNCDAWGTLKLPGRTDTTLRVHMTEVHRDSAHIVAGPFTIDSIVTLNIDQYVWYKPGYHTALLLYTTATMTGSSTPLYTLLAYAPKDFTAVDDIKLSAASIQLFPNPSNGVVNIKWSEMETGNAEIAVTDITGREVYKVNMTINAKAGQTQITLPEASSGIYFVSVKSGNVSYKGKIAIEK